MRCLPHRLRQSHRIHIDRKIRSHAAGINISSVHSCPPPDPRFLCAASNSIRPVRRYSSVSFCQPVYPAFFRSAGGSDISSIPRCTRCLFHSTVYLISFPVSRSIRIISCRGPRTCLPFYTISMHNPITAQRAKNSPSVRNISRPARRMSSFSISRRASPIHGFFTGFPK